MGYFSAKVLANDRIHDGVYSMKIAAGTAGVRPGQFYMLMPRAALLGRPLSVCELGDGWIEFCYAVVGKGTREFSQLRENDDIAANGPVGNGFDVDFINTRKRVAVVSGSVGIAPFVELVKRLTCEVSCFCGFHGGSYLTERLRNVSIATESGAEGHKGLVTEIFDPRGFELVLACGSEAFSKAVTLKCKDAGTSLLISLDRHMACGVGACLCCTCATAEGNKRCCVDGPVFWGEDLTC
ncbi:MAG: dihydroorotate dehydrogenase electron transfer subunit [Oscillospiraceae bacterium]|nr:dihydroorotate dehydrogenase electron transfer subunit [Oscillospiraceae bacterium]